MLDSYPLVPGLEIRAQVTDYVKDRIHALREQHASHASQSVVTPPEIDHPLSRYQNISVLRANSMKFLPNFFPRAALKHIFLCFPDPHFKARKHKARIVSETLCAEYAYVLRPGGLIWTITDVEDLAKWMASHFGDCGKDARTPPDEPGAFEAVDVPEDGKESEWADEEIGRLVRCIRVETEEGKKVSRNGGRKFVKVWRRKPDPPWYGEEG